MDITKISLIKKILSSQELKLVTSEYEKDAQLIPYFSFPDTDGIILYISSFSSIPNLKNEIDSNKKFNFDFQPNDQVLIHIFKNSDWDHTNINEQIYNLQILYSKYCLFSFIKLFIENHPDLKSQIFIQLIQTFTKLKKIKNNAVQIMINEIFSYMFLKFLHSFDKQSFEIIFPTLSDFLFNESYNIQIFSLIPEILHTLIHEYGFDHNSITAKFASIIQMILVEKLTIAKLLSQNSFVEQSSQNNNAPKIENCESITEKKIDKDDEEISDEELIAQKIFNCCQPFFLKLNDCALNLLCYLPKFLDDNKIDAFFLKFPFCFEQYIESEEKQFITIPQKDDNIYQFNPIQSPPSLSQFYDDIITFPKGLPFLQQNDKKSRNQKEHVSTNENIHNIQFFTSDIYNNHFHFKLSSINQSDDAKIFSKLLFFMSSELISKIVTVLKIIDDNKEKSSLTFTILNSFCELIKYKKESPYVFDYVALFTHILAKLPKNDELEVPFPSTILFDPAYEVTQELHFLRLCSIRALLNFDLKTLENLFKETIKYPLIMTEITLILIELGDIFFEIVYIRSPKRFFRLFKEIGSVYQYEDIHGKTDRELIETPRITLLSLLERSFQYKNIAEIIMKDTISIHFFLSHLFEVNLQPFIFNQLSFYIGKYDISYEFLQLLNQLFMQIVQLMPNKKAIYLSTGLISTIVKNSRDLKLFIQINDVLCNIIDKLKINEGNNNNDLNEESELSLSWKFLDEIFALLISYSISNIEIPQSMFDSIEKALIHFSSLPSELIDFIESSNQEDEPMNKNEELNIKIFEKLVQLLSGTFITKYDLIFYTSIVNFDALKVLFTVFQNSKIINIFKFAYKICCFSNLNCIECHNCGFDSILLEYIQTNREKFNLTKNSKNIKSIKNIEINFFRPKSEANLNPTEIISSNIYTSLLTVCEIMSITSSPSIVQQVISLFTPVQNYYITPLHPVLVEKIKEILNNEKNSPNVTVSFVQSHSIQINMETNFTFMCWAYIDSSTQAQVLNVKCNDLNSPFLTIAIDKQLIYVNKECTYVQIPKNRWIFFTAFFINNNNLTFSLDLGIDTTSVKFIDNLHLDEESAKLLFVHENSNQKSSNRHSSLIPFVVTIGGNGSNSGRIGNFAFFPNVDFKTINTIYTNGPRLNEYTNLSFIPFFYADDSVLRKLNLSSTNHLGEEKTFSSILLNSFEIETFLPLFAQLDFPFIPTEEDAVLSFNATDLANLLKAAFGASSIQRNQDFDFAILAHMLINSNPKHLTYELYTTFYSIYVQHLVSLNSCSDASFVAENSHKFLSCLTYNILINFELWYASPAEEQEKIIDFIKEQRIINFLPQLLIVLRMYYWYEPMTKMSSSLMTSSISNHFVEHGLPNTERQRDPKLNVKSCRRTLLSIFLPDESVDSSSKSVNIVHLSTESFINSYSSPSLSYNDNSTESFSTDNINSKSNSVTNLSSSTHTDVLTEDEFALIIGHCILIIQSAHDPFQVYDILEFLQHAKYSYISKEKLFLLHKILLNDLSDETMICLTIAAIIAIHKQVHYTNGFNISKHIDIVFSIVSTRPLLVKSSIFFESCIEMLNDCPDLFELCTFLSMHKRESILYHKIKPSPFFCIRKTWAFWAVINSMIIAPKNGKSENENDREKEAEASFILNFLIRCRPGDESWFSIYDSIRLASIVFNDFHFVDNRRRFLTLLGDYVLKNSNSLNDSQIEAAFMMIVFSILFRKHKRNSPTSNQLMKLFVESPFYTDDEVVKMTSDTSLTENLTNKMNFDDFSCPHQLINAVRSQSGIGIQVDFTFGLKIDDDFQWTDISLAELALSISVRFKDSRFYKASIIIASFIISSSNGGKSAAGYHKFIQWWYDEMNFSDKDREANLDFFNFFISKFNESHAPIPEWQSLVQIIDWNLVLRRTISLAESFSEQFGSSIYADGNFSSSSSSMALLSQDMKYTSQSSTQVMSSYLFESSYLDEFVLEIDRIIHKVVESVILLREDGMKKWELLWGNMTVIGGAWNFSCRHLLPNNKKKPSEVLDTIDSIAEISSTSINISDSRPKWKREFVTTSFYCPMKLKKNKRFNSHIEAALTREIGNYSNAQELVRAYRGKIEDQYRQQTQKTLLNLSDEFEQALNRSTSVSTVLKSKDESSKEMIQDDSTNVKRSLSMPKIQQETNGLVISQSFSNLSEESKKTSADLTSEQSSPSSSIASTHSLFKKQLKQQKKKKRQERNSLMFKCEIIKASKDILGVFSINEKKMLILITPPTSLIITTAYVSPTTTTEKIVATKTYRIPIRRISEIFMKKRFQHSTAIEIFCIDGKSFFINFQDKETPLKVVENIVKCIKYNIFSSNNPESLELPLILKSSLINQSGNFLKFVQKSFDFIDFFQQQPFTSKWVRGKMSNFEYLIKLNIFSGRSFTDLSLYPIFPWIISKFDSEILNLNDQSFFRDLTKPIGAIGEERLNELLERMDEMKLANQQMMQVMRRKLKQGSNNNNVNGIKRSSSHSISEMPPIGSSLMNLDDGFEDPYLYFSYVICPLAVFLYLIRMEPFTTLHIKMQSNKFDHGSRIFSSISDSFNSASTSLNNYRELPPDFFFSPEVLINENKFDLGSNKHGIIDDVELPKWVHNNDAFKFVYLMRKALESDFVSNFLPDWIDLMWGYKQRGEEAVKANNIYSSQLYDTVWETNTSWQSSSGKKAEIEATLCHVGQIPPQLFREHHARKEVHKEVPLFSSVSLVNFSQPSQPSNSTGRRRSKPNITDDLRLNENVISAFISFEKKNLIHLSICSTFETINNTKKSSTRKIDFLITDDKSVKILKESNYFTNSSKLVVKSFADESCFILLGGELFHPFSGVNVQEKVSTVSFNDGYMAAVVDNDSTVLLFGPELAETQTIDDSVHIFSSGQTKGKENDSNSILNFVGKPIKFYGEKVVCCELSPTFKVVVCGTKSGHVFTSSLFESVKVNVINLNDDENAVKKNKDEIFVPRKILITKSFGFIVCYAESVPSSALNDGSLRRSNEIEENKENDESEVNFDLNEFDLRGENMMNRKHSIFVFNINGRFIRKIDIGFRVSSWCTWMSHKSFDYVALGADDGRLLAFEAFALGEDDLIENEGDVSKWKKNGCFICLFSGSEKSRVVECKEKKGTIVGLTVDCKLVFAPLPSDFV